MESAMAQGTVRFGVLGALEMCVGDTIVPLGTPKQRAVLAMLAIHRNRAVAKDELISTAWQQSPPDGAQATLHTYVSNLRRLMTSPGIDAHAVLASAPPGYRLSVPDIDFDLGRFIVERSKGVQAAADARFEEASGHFSDALAEWRGPVLHDLRDFAFFDDFAIALAEDKLVTEIALAEAEIACGRTHSVINRLEALTTEHPYRESLWAQLIAAYYLAEHQSKALDAYHRLRDILAEDLSVEPGPTVRVLHEQILRGDPLDVGKAAQSQAEDTITTLHQHMAIEHPDGPVLRGDDGRIYPLLAMTTRIGRTQDNHVALADREVSRVHAAIIDTGSSFVIADLRSANGVYVQGRRIHTSVTLASGDRIRIGNHQFTFEATAT
jgi:SARP family transcriptional regulator, regulator of embCAB operon